jgi:hypothetical protein
VRAQECLDLLLALNAGLPGMASLHANSAREALVKLCTLPLLAGENISARFVVATRGVVGGPWWCISGSGTRRSHLAHPIRQPCERCCRPIPRLRSDEQEKRHDHHHDVRRNGIFYRLHR